MTARRTADALQRRLEAHAGAVAGAERYAEVLT